MIDIVTQKARDMFQQQREQIGRRDLHATAAIIARAVAEGIEVGGRAEKLQILPEQGSEHMFRRGHGHCSRCAGTGSGCR